MKILCKLILIVATITTGVNFGYAQIDAGFDVTFIVGNEPIDLFDGALTNEGTWSVDGGCLNGSLWDACGYQPFIEPFRDYVATLTNSSNESDSKTIRAYNKLDPSLIPIIPLSICQNSQYNVAPFEFDPPVTYYQSFSKRTFYQINGTGPFIEFTEKVRGSTLGSGNHVIRERYTNVVLSFVYTDIEKQITVRQNPELYWATPIPQLCTTDTPIDIQTYLNTTVGVTITSESVGLTGTLFDPSISGTGQFQVSAKKSGNGCITSIAYTIKVLNECE